MHAEVAPSPAEPQAPDDETALHGAEAIAALDAFCDEQARLRASLPPEVSRARGAAHDALNETLASDPECRAKREAGEDYTARAMELKRRALERHGFRVRRVPATSVAPSTIAQRGSGRAPRLATNTHTRGSRRNGSDPRAGPSDDPDDESDGLARTRTCGCGCGRDISHRAPQARFHSDACRMRDQRRRADPAEAVVPPPAKPRCPHPAAARIEDQDGDPVCLLCGTLVEHRGRVNGHDATLAEMRTDADGQDRRAPRKRASAALALRTRLLPRGLAPPKAARTCSACGAFLRSGTRGRLCSPCEGGAVH